MNDWRRSRRRGSRWRRRKGSLRRTRPTTWSSITMKSWRIRSLRQRRVAGRDTFAAAASQEKIQTNITNTLHPELFIYLMQSHFICIRIGTFGSFGIFCKAGPAFEYFKDGGSCGPTTLPVMAWTWEVGATREATAAGFGPMTPVTGYEYLGWFIDIVDVMLFGSIIFGWPAPDT